MYVYVYVYVSLMTLYSVKKHYFVYTVLQLCNRDGEVILRAGDTFYWPLPLWGGGRCREKKYLDRRPGLNNMNVVKRQ